MVGGSAGARLVVAGGVGRQDLRDDRAVSGDAWKEPTTGIYGNDYIAELRKQGLPPEEVSRRVRARDNETPEELTSDVEWRLLCFDARNGKKLWDAELHRGKPFGGRHRKNTYASETPVTDGRRVYVYLGNIGLFSYTLDGKRDWMTPIAARRRSISTSARRHHPCCTTDGCSS